MSEPMFADFCPVCGEMFPMHHSGVKHDFNSPLMKAYHAGLPLPEDDPHVVKIRASRAQHDRENAELIVSDDLEYLLDKEWSMGNGQCPVCCGCKPGFHSMGGVGRYNIGTGQSEMVSWYEAYPKLGDTEKHDDDCALAARIKELSGDGIIVTGTMISTKGDDNG